MKKSVQAVRKIFILIFLISLTNCQNEDTSLTNQDKSILEVKNWFKKNNKELSVLKYTKQIDWDHAIVTNGAKGKIIEVPIIL